MSNSNFEFRRFTVAHDLCAMKVGTDGVLLGAWANGGGRILDVGTGSGLIALCMAQRYPSASVTAIDVDEGAYRQAETNVRQSPFADRISVRQVALQQFTDGGFDAIVCNPPFFKDSLRCPDPRRTLARHASSLPPSDLFRHASRLLAEGGEVSVVVPAALRGDFDCEALMAGLAPSRAYIIKTVERKPASRCLLAYRKGAVGEVEEWQVCLVGDAGCRSAWYGDLTREFYIK